MKVVGMDGETGGGREVSVKESTDEWLAAVAEGAGLTETEMARKCLRYGLLNYEAAID